MDFDKTSEFWRKFKSSKQGGRALKVAGSLSSIGVEVVVVPSLVEGKWDVYAKAQNGHWKKPASGSEAKEIGEKVI